MVSTMYKYICRLVAGKAVGDFCWGHNSKCRLVSNRNWQHFTSSLSGPNWATWQRQKAVWQLSETKAKTETNTKHHLPLVPHKECQVCLQFPNVGSISPNILSCIFWRGGNILRESYQASDLGPVSLGSARPRHTKGAAVNRLHD